MRMGLPGWDGWAGLLQAHPAAGLWDTQDPPSPQAPRPHDTRDCPILYAGGHLEVGTEAGTGSPEQRPVAAQHLRLSSPHPAAEPARTQPSQA